MHELSAVDAMVRTLLQRFYTNGNGRVVSVKVRLSGSLTEEALRQAFQLLTEDTPLDGAELLVEIDHTSITCRCGTTHTTHAHHRFGPLFVCPSCGTMRAIEIDEELKLVEVTVETPDAKAAE